MSQTLAGLIVELVADGRLAEAVVTVVPHAHLFGQGIDLMTGFVGSALGQGPKG